MPHRGGGAETYINMLESLTDYEHDRFYLSSARTPRSAARSLPLRWPRLAARVRNADIVHTHGDAATVIALPLLRARPTVITTHGLNLLRRLIGARGAVMAKAFATSVGAAETLICTSPAEQAEAEHLVRARDCRKLRVIPNGIDPQQPVTARDRAAVRSQPESMTTPFSVCSSVSSNRTRRRCWPRPRRLPSGQREPGSCLLSQAPALRRRGSRPSRLTRCGRLAIAQMCPCCWAPPTYSSSRRSARECRSRCSRRWHDRCR